MMNNEPERDVDPGYSPIVLGSDLARDAPPKITNYRIRETDKLFYVQGEVDEEVGTETYGGGVTLEKTGNKIYVDLTKNGDEPTLSIEAMEYPNINEAREAFNMFGKAGLTIYHGV